MRGGRVAYSGAIRSQNPVLCMQRALGYHLVSLYTLKGSTFPDPRDSEAWYSAALFPTTDPTRNITYEQLHANLKEMLTELGIAVTKVTHIFRVGGARMLDECGVDDQVRRLGSAGAVKSRQAGKVKGRPYLGLGRAFSPH